MQSKNGHIKGIFDVHGKEVNVNLSLIEFEEDGCQVVYCPALDVSGYGTTETEATQYFATSLSAFFQYCVNKKTLTDELHRLGWKGKTANKRMSPPDMSQLLSENENFSRIFNTHAFKKYDRQIEIPIA